MLSPRRSSQPLTTATSGRKSSKTLMRGSRKEKSGLRNFTLHPVESRLEYLERRLARSQLRPRQRLAPAQEEEQGRLAPADRQSTASWYTVSTCTIPNSRKSSLITFAI